MVGITSTHLSGPLMVGPDGASRSQAASTREVRTKKSSPTPSPAPAYSGLRALAGPAFAGQLAALEDAARNSAPDIDQRISDMFARYDVRGFVREFGRSALLPESTYGRSVSAPNHPIPYGVDGIALSDYNALEYHARLAPLVSKVRSGELSPDEARMQAARPVLSTLRGLFSDFRGTEIANLDEGRGVLFTELPGGALAVATQGAFKPTFQDLSKRSWRDLASTLVIGADGKVLSVDPFEPARSYESVIRGLRYVGDCARFLESTRTPA